MIIGLMSRNFTRSIQMVCLSRIDERLRDKCFTFDSYFNSYHNRDISHLKDKTIFIEEHSVTPNIKVDEHDLSSIHKYHNTVFMFGDTNQCDPVEKGRQIHYDFDSVAISEMCPRRVQMKCKEGCSRYDIKTKKHVNEVS